MSAYLADVEYAANGLLELIWQERSHLRRLSAQLDQLIRSSRQYRADADWITQNAEDAETFMLGVSRRWDSYFGPEKAAHELAREIDVVSAAVETKQYSIAELSSTFLQLGCGGLKRIHSGKPKPGLGRRLCSLPLSEIVWEGRNQGIHWSENGLRKPAISCFEALRSDFNEVFGDYNSRNLSFEVIDLLEWNSIDSFQLDMLTLG